MIELILFVGMTVSLVYVLQYHETLKQIREKISTIYYEKKRFLFLPLHKIFTCEYCCGFVMAVISLVCVRCCIEVNYLFSAAIITHFIFKNFRLWQ